MPDTRYKTKLCTLYQQGNCNRTSCTFAHGEEELRGKPPGRFYQYRGRSYNRRRFDNRFYDREATRSWSPNTGRPSKSPEPSSPRSTGQKRSGSNIEREGEDKKARKLELQSDLSDSRFQGESNSKGVESNGLIEKAQKAQAELDDLESQRTQLENNLEDANNEIKLLRSTISEYDAKLAEMTSINKKLERFQKAYTRVLHCQEDLKRLQKLVQEEEYYYRRVDDDEEFYYNWRPSYDPVYDEADVTKWRSRAPNGPSSNGLDEGRRVPLEFDDRNISPRHTYINSNAP